MPPRNVDVSPASLEEELAEIREQPGVAAEGPVEKHVPTVIVWRNVIWFFLIHCMAVYGLFLLPYAQPATWVWAFALYLMNALGITAGVHRLWTHRSYRARLPLRIILAIFNSIAFQNDIIEWSRDHRMHHKYSETDADPHNAKRGFFFSHCGWLMCLKHPAVKEKGKDCDITDLLNDPVCRFQRKVYVPSVILLCFVVPTVVPKYFWGETAWNAFFICAILRYIVALNVTWTVNSVAHLWGNKPYDRRINPVENCFVAVTACGEGFHNYHHVFPFDYAAAEHRWMVNPTTFFIDCMAAIGLVTERKKMSAESVQRRRERTGDGTTGFGFFQKCN